MKPRPKQRSIRPTKAQEMVAVLRLETWAEEHRILARVQKSHSHALAAKALHGAAVAASARGGR